MAWVEKLRIEDLRVLRRVEIELGPGLNVFFGSNAQGKTSVLEAIALLARGRSFRTDDLATLIRHGMTRTLASAEAEGGPGRAILAVELTSDGRRFARDGRVVPFREYNGHIEAAVYGTERLKVIHGGMRERRLWIDRSASALSATYRKLAASYEKAVQQRNASLQQRSRDLSAWDEAVLDFGADLRLARSEYAEKLNRALETGYRPNAELYAVASASAPGSDKESLKRAFRLELTRSRGAELQAGRTLSGPHRDAVVLTIDGEDAARFASAGQSRSLLLALTLATLAVHEAETREPAIALLDDLDSELDESRAAGVCEAVARRGQALVTTAHPAWARSVAGCGRLFSVEDGNIEAA